MAKTFKKGEIEVKLGEKVGSSKGGDVFDTSLGDFSIADLETQGFTEMADVPTEPDQPLEVKDPNLTIDDMGKEAVDVPAFDKNILKDQISGSLTKAGDQALANKEFINAVSRYAYGRDASKDEIQRIGEGDYGLVGAGVNDVLRRFGVGEDFDVLLDAPKEDGVKEDKVADKIEKDLTPIEEIIKSREDIGTQISNVYNKLTGKLEILEDKTLDEESTAIAEAKVKAQNIKDELEEMKIMDIKELEDLKDEPMYTSSIRKAIQDLSFDQKIDVMMKQQEYNNALVKQQIAQGNYDRAQEIIQNTANDYYERAELQLQALQAQDEIEQREYTRLQSELEYDRDLRLSGYTPIENLEEAMLEFGRDRIYTDPVTGKSYIEPEVEQEIIEWEWDVIEDAKGNEQVVRMNPLTGEIIYSDENIPEGGSAVITVGGQGYDISTYAEDPKHEQKVFRIIKDMGKLDNQAEMSDYINNTNPDSPITADMVANASKEYGVGWEMILGIMQQDSSLGTSGIAVRTKNPGNVGTFGDNVGKYATWQAGVDAVARWLNKHRTTQPTETLSDFDSAYQVAIENIGKYDSKSDLEFAIQSSVSRGEVDLNQSEINDIAGKAWGEKEEELQLEKFSGEWWKDRWNKAEQAGQSVDFYLNKWKESGIRPETVIKGLGFKGLTTDEIYDKIIEYYNEDELKEKAKDAGLKGWFESKKSAIKDYIESLTQ